MRKMRNPWVIAFLIFLPISIYNAPKYQLSFGFQNMGGLWMWQTLAWILGYYLLYLAIGQLRVNLDKGIMIARCIGWVAVISSVYAILQFLGLDQFQTTRTYNEIGQPVAPEVTAFIGNPTYLGVFLALSLPFCCLFMRWWWPVLVFIAILMCQSDFAIGGAIVTAGFMLCMKAKNTAWLKLYIGAGFLAALLLLCFSSQLKLEKRANGRLVIWKQTIEDWRSPPILLKVTPEMPDQEKLRNELLNKRTNVLTGRGPGSFPFLFGTKHQSKWDDPHNVYLRTLYEYGILGLTGLLGMLGWVFWHKFQEARWNRFTLALYSSFFFICLAAIGIPMLHVEPLRFYCVVVFALLSL